LSPRPNGARGVLGAALLAGSAAPVGAEAGRNAIAGFLAEYAVLISGQRAAAGVAPTSAVPTAVAVAAREVEADATTRFLRDGLMQALRRQALEPTAIEPAERSRLDPGGSFDERAIFLARLLPASVVVLVEVVIRDKQVIAAVSQIDLESGERRSARELPLGTVEERVAIQGQARPTRVSFGVRGAFAGTDLLGPATVSAGDLGGNVAYSWQLLHGGVGVDVAVTARIIASFAYRYGLSELSYVREGDPASEPTEVVEVVSLLRQITPSQSWLNSSAFELGGGYRIDLSDQLSVLVRGVVPMRYAFGRVATAGVETQTFERFLWGFGAGAEVAVSFTPTLHLGLNVIGYQLAPVFGRSARWYSGRVA
jgi:hypothetical protein